MPIIAGTLARYFGLRFINAVLIVFVGIFALVALIDYIELMRRAGDIPNVSAALVAKTCSIAVPQVVERILPFCVLIGAMSCYLNLSRGSNWWLPVQLECPHGNLLCSHRDCIHFRRVIATTFTIQYRPRCRSARSASRLNFSGRLPPRSAASGGTFWMNQRTDEGQAIINAVASRDQGINLNGVSIFVFDIDGRFKQRIEARAAVLVPGAWVLRDIRLYGLGTLPTTQPEYRLKTSLTPSKSAKLCYSRNRPVLGSSRVYSDRRTRRACSGRL